MHAYPDLVRSLVRISARLLLRLAAMLECGARLHMPWVHTDVDIECNRGSSYGSIDVDFLSAVQSSREFRMYYNAYAAAC